MNKEEVKLYKSVTEMQHRINELEAENEQAKEIIKTLCDGYSSAVISENEMFKRIVKAEEFLKE